MADITDLPNNSLAANCGKNAFWIAAFEKDTVARALKVAAIVGTILIAINQADVILSGGMPPLWKILLTYCVPYSVSTYSAASFKVAYRCMTKEAAG